MRRTRWTCAVAAALAATAVLGTGGTAHANSSWTAQARQAGLTAPEATALQKRVDSYLPAMRDSYQSGPNTIGFPGGQITVAVPGERHARDLRTTPGPLAAMNCNYGNFCATMDGNATQWDFYYCQYYDVASGSPTLAGPGAWINNQTHSRRVRMYGSGGSTDPIYTTPNAFYQDPSANWDPVYGLRTCVAAA
ncbi:hypothetical protein AB0C95_26955 [Streptomyces caniferus]|uniref:hypothetical protein n=1 Tax=Streptomyces caniferus TaxID=285557 RepID=UPI0033FA02CF